MLGMENLVDSFGREVNVSRSGVIFFWELFVQLCICDLGEVVFFFII